MFSHVMIGTNDLDKAKSFYDALLGTLGVKPGFVDRHRIFWRTKTGTFSASKPIDGKAATFANGGTIGFAASSPADVNAFHADLSALPPVYVQCGGDESGRGDSERLAKLTGARLDVFDGQLHTFQMVAGRASVADEAIGRLAAWVRPKLGL